MEEPEPAEAKKRRRRRVWFFLALLVVALWLCRAVLQVTKTLAPAAAQYPLTDWSFPRLSVTIVLLFFHEALFGPAVIILLLGAPYLIGLLGLMGFRLLERRPIGRPLRAHLIACAVLWTVSLALCLAISLAAQHWPSGRSLMEVHLTGIEKVAGFSFSTPDPHAYWGPETVTEPVHHESFDTIMVNDVFESGEGYVVIGLQKGKIVSFGTWLVTPKDARLVVNERKIRLPTSRAHLAREDLIPIAKELTGRQVTELSALADLLTEHCPAIEARTSESLVLVADHFGQICEALAELKKEGR